MLLTVRVMVTMMMAAMIMIRIKWCLVLSDRLSRSLPCGLLPQHIRMWYWALWTQNSEHRAQSTEHTKHIMIQHWTPCTDHSISRLLPKCGLTQFNSPNNGTMWDGSGGQIWPNISHNAVTLADVALNDHHDHLGEIDDTPHQLSQAIALVVQVTFRLNIEKRSKIGFSANLMYLIEPLFAFVRIIQSYQPIIQRRTI